jgi:hypothetical protein
MDPVKVGLKETKEVLDAMIALGKGIEKSLEDGKFNLMDIPNFIQFLTLILPAIEDADQVPFEFSVADPEDIEELKQYLNENLDLADDKLEAFIEDAFKVALDIFMLVKLYFTTPEGNDGQGIPQGPTDSVE